MDEALISFLTSAVRNGREITFKFDGFTVILRLHVLYPNRSGEPQLAGLTAEDVPLQVPALEVKDITVTGRSFDADPIFNLDDPRYRDAFAIVQRF